jgi:hypothetical protein
LEHAVRLLPVLATTLLLASCSTPATPEVPHAQQPTTAVSGPAALGKETDYDKALRFVRCLNDKRAKVNRYGQPMAAIQDPVVGEPLPVYDAPKDVFDQCKQFLPSTWPIREDPAELAKEKPYRACLREHGIDAPEPDSSGLIAYPANPYAETDPANQAATDACIHLYNDPALNQ